jgi:aspartate kinase
MKVFKFGGGIIKDAASVRRLPAILRLFPNDPLMVVISAMGKTTNALEDLTRLYFEGKNCSDSLQHVISYHKAILEDLFEDRSHEVFKKIASYFEELSSKLSVTPGLNYDFEYDRLIGYGEIISSLIVHHYLTDSGISNRWMDVRELIRTDSNYREANVDWSASEELTGKKLRPYYADTKGAQAIIVTQGFIAADADGNPTSLGREGSDYTAGIFGHLLDAREVIIWKDVPGVLNADPLHFRDTVKLEEISYNEAMELAYFGAKIIHPKTIKPLQDKEIPLEVRSFDAPSAPGTLIYTKADHDAKVPSFIVKQAQTLVSLSTRDHSFITENHLDEVFRLISDHSVRINLVQNSAVSLSICLDQSRNLPSFLAELKKKYHVRYNENLLLITIRHYTPAAIEKGVRGRKILLEQRSRATVQFVVD